MNTALFIQEYPILLLYLRVYIYQISIMVRAVNWLTGKVGVLVFSWLGITVNGNCVR